MNKKCRRGLSIIFCVIILSVLVLSLSYLALKSHHDCVGEDCPVCAELELCEQILYRVGTGLVITLFTLSVFFCFTEKAVRYIYSGVLLTLIAQKVRMNC